MTVQLRLILVVGFVAVLLSACAYQPKAREVFPQLSYERSTPAIPRSDRPAREGVLNQPENNFVFDHREPAVFSVKAQEAGASGTVMVRARVDGAGVVQSIDIDGKVHPLLEPAVREATRRCTFKRRFAVPEKSGGYQVRITFTF